MKEIFFLGFQCIIDLYFCKGLRKTRLWQCSIATEFHNAYSQLLIYQRPTAVSADQTMSSTGLGGIYTAYTHVCMYIYLFHFYVYVYIIAFQFIYFHKILAKLIHQGPKLRL